MLSKAPFIILSELTPGTDRQVFALLFQPQAPVKQPTVKVKCTFQIFSNTSKGQTIIVAKLTEVKKLLSLLFLSFVL